MDLEIWQLLISFHNSFKFSTWWEISPRDWFILTSFLEADPKASHYIPPACRPWCQCPKNTRYCTFYLCRGVSVFVCYLDGFLKNYRMDYHKTVWKDAVLVRDEPIWCFSTYSLISKRIIHVENNQACLGDGHIIQFGADPNKSPDLVNSNVVS